jgi:hypothetical protein
MAEATSVDITPDSNNLATYLTLESNWVKSALFKKINLNKFENTNLNNLIYFLINNN